MPSIRELETLKDLSDRPFKDLINYYQCDEISNSSDYHSLIDAHRKLFHYCTTVFARCFQDHNTDTKRKRFSKAEEVAGSIVLLLYRNALELFDAILILADKCATSPATIQLRSMFETMLYIKYLLNDEQLYIKRAMSYLYYIRKDDLKVVLRIKEMLNESSPDSIAYKSLTELTEKVNLDEQERKYTEALEADYLTEVKSYVDANKNTSSSKKWKWYSLFNGVDKTKDTEIRIWNIRGLAVYLELKDRYDILYRAFSTKVHPTNLRHHLETSEGELFVKMLRVPEEFSMLMNVCRSNMLVITQDIYEKFRPSELERFKIWYRDNMSPIINYKLSFEHDEG